MRISNYDHQSESALICYQILSSNSPRRIESIEISL